ncbi:MAG: membrane dipeptidase [Lachnospiraceae bacterium]|jgi:membrane dipeptidase|nr:membrane dipeptidase [Lachnospiraceae bacterium]
MSYIDMHCDTLMMALFKNANLNDSKDVAVDFKRMKEAGALAQFFAIYMPDKPTYELFNIKPMEDQEYFDATFALFLKNLQEHQDVIARAYTAKDVLENRQKGLMSAILTMEDGRMVNGDFEKLEDFYDLGVRALALTWNYENCFGFPNSDDADVMSKGLKPFGKEAIGFMNELGMLVDVSHLSDGGFWDVAKISEKPFIATHSNCRELSPHRRNLSDEMIKVLAEHGGVMGLNFCGAFLNADTKCEKSTIDAMVAHLKHARKVGGIEVVALGSDLDGFAGEMDISHCGEFPKLFDRLQKEGFTESELDKITHENVLRVMKDTLWG